MSTDGQRDRCTGEVATTVHPGRDVNGDPGLSGTADNRSLLGAYYVNGGEQLGLRTTALESDPKPMLKGSAAHSDNLGQHPSTWDCEAYCCAGCGTPPQGRDCSDCTDPSHTYPDGESGQCYPGDPDLTNSGKCRLVNIEGHFWTIQDLEVTNGWGKGIGTPNGAARYSDIEVLRNAVHHTGAAGISITDSDNGVIEGNEVTHAGLHWAAGSTGWCNGGGWPAGVGIHGNNATVRANRIHDHLTEGIVVGKGADVGVVEYNYVWNTRSVGIYVNTGRNITLQHNLVVGTNDPTYYCDSSERPPGSGRYWSGGMVVRNEPHFYPPSDNATVRGNVVIGASTGITISNSVYDGTADTEILNTQIYNNSLIGNYIGVNLNVGNSSGCAFRDLVFRNNVIYFDESCPSCLLQTQTGWGQCDDNGFITSHNLWSEPPPPIGPSDSTDVVWQPGQPLFARMDDWSQLTGWDDFATGDFFPVVGSITSSGATSAVGYDQLLSTSSDFHATPIEVRLATQDASDWTFGACMVPE